MDELAACRELAAPRARCWPSALLAELAAGCACYWPNSLLAEFAAHRARCYPSSLLVELADGKLAAGRELLAWLDADGA